MRPKHSIMARYSLALLFIPCLLMPAVKNDFELAKQHYDQGEYEIAQIYFEHLLQEEPLSKYVADATYYLINISDYNKELLNVLSYCDQFINNFKYDSRVPDVFNMFLNRLIENHAWLIAYKYIREYEYLPADAAVLERIGYGLLKQHNIVLADSIFSMCQQTDTIKILRAQLQPQPKEKIDFYKSLSGIKGNLYLAEYYLLTGDTVRAYDEYRVISAAEINNDLLYRISKLVLLFDRKAIKDFTARLAKIKGASNKAKLLNALATGHLERSITPIDEEEQRMLIAFYAMDSVTRSLPDSISLDSLLSDTTDFAVRIEALRTTVSANFCLDSIYSQILIARDEIAEAHEVVLPYLKYFNVCNYVRVVQARAYFNDEDYDAAMNDVILSNDKSPEMILLFVECLRNIGEYRTDLFAEVMNTTEDSLLHFRAFKGYVESEFADKDYKKIISYDIGDLQNDTSLIRIYLRSLVRTGKKEEADSIFIQCFVDRDYDLINDYGEFLINQKEYTKAEDFYDFHIHARYDVPEKFYYNWALVSFLHGKLDTALSRFGFYAENFKDSPARDQAFFKIATINYLQENYDTASYYYSLASEDSSLRENALHNQLISYKKAGNWSEAIDLAEKMVSNMTVAEEPEIRFELGYAFLRNNEINNAVDNLKIAVRLRSDPEYYYWLGEAYLAKGDFIRALYQFQKIVDLFPNDKMWLPTAQYKVGIVFEFLNESDAAKKTYKEMIKKRGSNDTWGVEAQKRLEVLE